jgi:hypothetical protein
VAYEIAWKKSLVDLHARIILPIDLVLNDC